MPTMQISGLASGLDTENVIKQLMEIERRPVTLLEQRKADLNLEYSAWGDVRTRLTSLQSPLTTLKLSSTFTAKKATSSNESILTATAGANAQSGVYSITVDRLAKAHMVASDVVGGNFLEDTFTSAAKIDLDPAKTTAYVDYNAGLVKLGAAAPYTSGKAVESVNVTTDAGGSPLNLTKFRFYANASVPAGTAINYYYSTDGGTTWTLIADPGTTGTEATLGTAATQLKFKAEFTTTDSNVTPILYDYRFEDISKTFEGTFKINGKSITVPAGTTSLTAIRDLINQANAGVTASVIDNQLVITSNTTGTGGRIIFEDDPVTDILTKLGILKADDTIKNEKQPAQDAQFSLNGVAVTRHTNTISDLLTGVTISLKDTTASPVTLTVANDTEATISAIQAFVDQYNSVMDFLATKMGKTATGKPAELFGDPTAARIQQQLKQLVTDRVAGLTGKYTSLADIGITTEDTTASLGFSQAGKLTIDTAKLQAALEDDPGAVAVLFNSNTGTVKGVAVRLASYVDSLVKYGTGVGAGIINNRQNMISEQMKDLEEQIARWEDRLALREERLWRQFTTLEQALSTMQAQGTWLSSQILTLPGFQAARSNSR